MGKEWNTNGEKRKAKRKTRAKRPLRRRKRRWVDNIKMDL
jgi:hypothetical protein